MFGYSVLHSSLAHSFLALTRPYLHRIEVYQFLTIFPNLLSQPSPFTSWLFALQALISSESIHLRFLTGP